MRYVVAHQERRCIFGQKCHKVVTDSVPSAGGKDPAINMHRRADHSAIAESITCSSGEDSGSDDSLDRTTSSSSSSNINVVTETRPVPETSESLHQQETSFKCDWRSSQSAPQSSDSICGSPGTPTSNLKVVESDSSAFAAGNHSVGVVEAVAFQPSQETSDPSIAYIYIQQCGSLARWPL